MGSGSSMFDVAVHLLQYNWTNLLYDHIRDLEFEVTSEVGLPFKKHL